MSHIYRISASGYALTLSRLFGRGTDEAGGHSKSGNVGAIAGGAAGGGGAVINSEEFIKFQANQHKFAAQLVELYMRYLVHGSRDGETAFDKRKQTASPCKRSSTASPESTVTPS